MDQEFEIEINKLVDKTVDDFRSKLFRILIKREKKLIKDITSTLGNSTQKSSRINDRTDRNDYQDQRQKPKQVPLTFNRNSERPEKKMNKTKKIMDYDNSSEDEI
jgi:hypothetical protein